MTHGKIRVVVADDHPAIIEGVLARLREQPQLHVVGVARSFAELRELLDQYVADVVVLDLVGMGEAPLVMVHHLQKHHPRLAIVVFSSEVARAPELLEAGALGFIVKHDLTSQLAEAIGAAHRGRTVVSPAVEDSIAQRAMLSQRASLTPREQSILSALASGFHTIEIAAQHGIEPRTAQNHITSLLRKTGCTHRGELVAWYRRQTRAQQ